MTMEGTVQFEQKMGMTTIKTMEMGWSFLQGLGTPEEISITGQIPIPVDFDLGDYFTRTLHTLGILNRWWDSSQ